MAIVYILSYNNTCRSLHLPFKAYRNRMYGENYVWMVTSTPDANITSDWWNPELPTKLDCTRSQMEEALDHHFNFYYKNEINDTLVSGKVHVVFNTVQLFASETISFYSLITKNTLSHLTNLRLTFFRQQINSLRTTIKESHLRFVVLTRHLLTRPCGRLPLLLSVLGQC